MTRQPDQHDRDGSGDSPVSARDVRSLLEQGEILEAFDEAIDVLASAW